MKRYFKIEELADDHPAQDAINAWYIKQHEEHKKKCPICQVNQ